MKSGPLQSVLRRRGRGTDWGRYFHQSYTFVLAQGGLEEEAAGLGKGQGNEYDGVKMKNKTKHKGSKGQPSNGLISRLCLSRGGNDQTLWEEGRGVEWEESRGRRDIDVEWIIFKKASMSICTNSH